MTAAALRSTAARLPDLCLVLLRLAGWSAVTGLAAGGCLVLFFAMLGGFTADGFFAHLDNLATRFAAADLARREHFLWLARFVAAVLAGLLGACRWRSLIRCLCLSEDYRHG